MQSDGDSFCGVVVLYSFNKTYQDEDNILDQIYIKQKLRIFFMIILFLYENVRNAY